MRVAYQRPTAGRPTEGCKIFGSVKISAPTLMLLGATMYFIGVATPASAALKGYDCSKNTSLAEDISILELLPPCDTIVHYRSTSAKIIQRSGTEATITAYLCKVTFTQILVDVSGSSRNVSRGTEEIGRTACLQAHERKILELSGRKIPHLETAGTITHTVRLDDAGMEKSEEGEGFIPEIGLRIIGATQPVPEAGRDENRHSKRYEITLLKKEGSVDLEKDIISFDDGIHCDYGKFSCQEDQGEIFWISTELRIHEDESKILYDGKIWIVGTNQSIINHEVLYAVVQHPDRKTAIAVRVFDRGNGLEYHTDIPDVYVKPSGGILSRNFQSHSHEQNHGIPSLSLMSLHPIFFHRHDPIEPIPVAWDHPHFLLPHPPPLFDRPPTVDDNDDGWEIASNKLDDFVSRTFQTIYPSSSLQVSDAVRIGKRRCENDGPDVFRRFDSLLVGSRVEYGRKGVIGVRTGKNEFSTYDCEVCNVRLKKTGEHLVVIDEQGKEKFLNPFSRVLTGSAPASERQNNPLKYDMYIAEESMLKEPDSAIASDWLKIVLIVLVALWGVGFLVRILVKCCSRGDGRGKFDFPGNPDAGKGETNVALYQEVFSLLKPPFMK